MILVNGNAATAVPATDRGLAYGDGVFRTLAVRNGRPVAWQHQFAKLRHDCLALHMACPSEAELLDDLARILPVQRECAVKIMVTRGEGRRGYAVPEAPGRPTRIVIVYPQPEYPAAYATDGVTVRCCTLRLGLQPLLGGIKHLNRLENVLARMEWTDPGIAEGLLLDPAGNVIGGTMSNLFIVEDGALTTPELAACGVAGVTRQRVLEAAVAHGIACRVEPLTLARLLNAREVFLVNSLIGAWPVRRMEGHIWASGQLTAAAQRWLNEENV